MRPARATLIVTAFVAAAVAAAACGGRKSSSKPGTGEVTFANLRGTAYYNGTAELGTHVLDVDVRLPQNAPALDPTSNYVEGEALPPQGCRVEHFSASKPRTDVDSGSVTFSGYTTQAIAFENSAYQPVTTPIACAVGGSGRYECRFAMSGTSGGGLVQDAFFPLIPYEVVQRTNPSNVLSTLPNWPYGDAACIKRLVDNPQDPNPSNPVTYLVVCEQPTLFRETQIGESVAGGTVYGAANATIGSGADFPFPIAVVDAKSGATSIAATDTLTGGVSLSFADGSLAATSPFTVSYQCYSTTAGLGCSGNLAELKLESSPLTKGSFTESSVDGEIDCFAPITVASNSYTMSMTVNSAQMAALLGGKSGGSVKLELINLSRQTRPAGSRSVNFGAGAGVFGSVNE